MECKSAMIQKSIPKDFCRLFRFGLKNEKEKN